MIVKSGFCSIHYTVTLAGLKNVDRYIGNIVVWGLILGLQPRDKAAMLVVNTKEFFWQNLHQNRAHFPAERNAFVFDPQHGRRDVTCKPAI